LIFWQNELIRLCCSSRCGHHRPMPRCSSVPHLLLDSVVVFGHCYHSIDYHCPHCSLLFTVSYCL